MDNKFTWFYVGEDVKHQTTFKYWFALMWGQWCIQLFFLSLLIISAWIFGWYQCPWQIGIIGLAMLIAVSYFGFYKDYQKDKDN